MLNLSFELIILISLQNMQEKVTLMDFFNRQPAVSPTPQKNLKKPKPSQKYHISYLQQWYGRWPSFQDLVLAGPFKKTANAEPWDL